ncbi:MAG: hypothetical protein CM1200mP2_29230 [Planctomycetaceae bacterium]|nr:MAG: hypothetical protein CM1200mP2_29230 [Planctomycetaceae bacterium]
MNIKITTQDDLEMARLLIRAVPQDDLLDRLHPFSEVDPKSVRETGSTLISSVSDARWQSLSDPDLAVEADGS